MKLYRAYAAIIAAGLSSVAFAEQTDKDAVLNDNKKTAIEMNVTTENTDENVQKQREVTYDRENGVLPIADNRGFSLASKDGKFILKPYLMLQTTLRFNYYPDEGLDKAYNQDNVANSGFAIPFGIIGFTGKAFGKIDYNVCVNAAAKGGALLQQAWIDYAASKALRFRVGKQKTPFAGAFLTTLGETLFPAMPSSLICTTILPYSLNAVNPTINTGWDLGVKMHGLIADKWGYELGLFNGTGGNVNTATKGFSDDNHFPSLLYAARVTFQGNGAMPMSQGNPNLLGLGTKYLVGLSVNYNNEAENESTNDLRAGVEFALLSGPWSVAAEGYYMHVGFTKRMKITDRFNYMGGYAQLAYFLNRSWQLGVRYDWMDRNGTRKDGSLNSPGVVCNYFVPKTNIKLSAMYQYTGRWGHDTQADRDLDNLGLATHSAMILMQYAF
ncbi:phosphate-selective porin O/P [Hallella colorans]|uniref:Phosphate-selective porin O/P n=2 Tax=Hallella colorans TaxID=1703337 RepID=A0A2U0TZ17_9BACT|nr:porin [Hallella colorans]PVX48864.1 phosphate-selective porin O/P [Hallella colorans]